MNLRQICFLALVCASLNSKQVVAGRLSHEEMITISNLVKKASAKTDGLFEAGPEPSKSVPAFDKLRSILTERHAEAFPVLLGICENRDDRHVLIFAFQGKSPSLYMTVLEGGLAAFSAAKLDIESFFYLLSPRGPLEGMVAYNYRHPRMVRFLKALRSKLETSTPRTDDEKDLKTTLLQGIQPIESGVARTAFLEDRKFVDHPPPLPILP